MCRCVNKYETAPITDTGVGRGVESRGSAAYGTTSPNFRMPDEKKLEPAVQRLIQRLRARLRREGLPTAELDVLQHPSPRTVRPTPAPQPSNPAAAASLLTNEQTDVLRAPPTAPWCAAVDRDELVRQASESRKLVERLGAGEACASCSTLSKVASGDPLRPPRLAAQRARPVDGTEPCGSYANATCAMGARVAPAVPRVYIYPCMDDIHKRLLSLPRSAHFFDATGARNQYLSEFALHRSLLIHPARVSRPEAAQLFFVPFYSRMLYADRVAPASARALQRNATRVLRNCLATSAHYRRSHGRDHIATLSSTRDPKKLFGEAWTLLRRSLLLRIEAADNRYQQRGRLQPASQLVMPYFVPRYAADDASPAVSKTHSVCFFGTATNPLRRHAIKALRGVGGARLSLARSGGYDGSRSARLAENQRTASTREELRRCKLCLVPAGLTPSSRRFYEALVAKCVPLLLADSFIPAFTSLWPLDSFAVRAPQNDPAALPRVVEAALSRWPQLYDGVVAARASFVLGLGMHVQRPPACDATHSLLTELGRFVPR